MTQRGLKDAMRLLKRTRLKCNSSSHQAVNAVSISDALVEACSVHSCFVSKAGCSNQPPSRPSSQFGYSGESPSRPADGYDTTFCPSCCSSLTPAYNGWNFSNPLNEGAKIAMTTNIPIDRDLSSKNTAMDLRSGRWIKPRNPSQI